MGGAACFTQENGEVLETRRERPLLGVLLLFAGMQVLPVMDGIAKLLSSRYPLLEVVWARYFFHLALLLPVVLWRYRGRALRIAHPHLQLFRGVLMLGATGAFFAAIARIPIADALAIAFVSPLLITAMSPCAYSEIIGAVAIGWWLFGDFPEAWTWVGICVVAASGIYITLRERRVGGA